jgi:hypothetical protein
MCRSTCFGRLHAHHQEFTTALAASGFTLESGDSSVVGRGRADRPDHDQQQCYPHAPTVKPEAATAIVGRGRAGRPDHDQQGCYHHVPT